jgi:hypothetical protein
MDIEQMNDWEIQAVLQKRSEARQKAEEARRIRVANMIDDVMKSDSDWNEIILAEAKRCLGKSDYEYLESMPHEALKGMSIVISFSSRG